MAQQGKYPIGSRTLAGTDTLTGVVAGATADLPVSQLTTFIAGPASTLVQSLASYTNSVQGAGQLGYAPDLAYPIHTVGAALRLRLHLRMWSAFVGDGTTDDSGVVQTALNYISAQGGGTLMANGCKIGLGAKITIPTNVRFEGDSWLPDPANLNTINGTALWINWGAGADNHAVELSYSSGIEGFTIYYPGQVTKTAATPTAYGYSLSTPTAAGIYDNIHVKNMTLYNSYKGLRLNNAGRWRVEGLQGDPLFMGFTSDGCADVCYMDGVHFWNFYTQSAALETWVAANATAFEFYRIDQLLGSRLFAWNRNIAYHFRDSFWGEISGLLADKANYPIIIDNASQLSLSDFTLIGSGRVGPAIWGKSISSPARFSNGRITDAGSVGAQIDAGTAYLFDNVAFDCPHSAVVNLSTTTEVRLSSTCRWQVPPFGTWNTLVSGIRLPQRDTFIALPTPTTGGGASAVTGGYRFPLSAVANPTVYWDVTTILQRCGPYVLEFDLTVNGTPSTTWYFQFSVAKDVGTSLLVSYQPSAPLALNVGAVTRRIRIPFFANYAQYKTVMRIYTPVTVAMAGASIDVTNISLYEQASVNLTDSQVGMLLQAGFGLDPYGKGQTLSSKGKARRIITEPEAGVGRTGATPTAGTWAVGDEILLDTPTAGASPGVVCTTAGTYGGVAPVFKALPNLAA